MSCADRVFCVVSRVVSHDRSRGSRASRDFIEHVLWHFVGEEGEIVSVERAECHDELVSRKFIDERGSSRFARLDEGGAGLLQSELTENEKAIVGGQRVENRRDVSRVLEPDVALQLHQILAVLHLLEQVVARCLLPAGERRQDAMTLQQARDFVAGFATVCSGDHGRVEPGTSRRRCDRLAGCPLSIILDPPPGIAAGHAGSIWRMSMTRQLCALVVAGGVLTAVPLAHGDGNGSDRGCGAESPLSLHRVHSIHGLGGRGNGEQAAAENVQPQFAPYEKVEGLAVTEDGDLWVALDNDGGEFESRLVRYRNLIR